MDQTLLMFLVIIGGFVVVTLMTHLLNKGATD
jgi:hypothetical protein